MNFKTLILFLPVSFLFSACCALDFIESGDELCSNQYFIETRNVPIENTYTVNQSGQFTNAANLTAHDIQSALHIDGGDFEIIRIELTSAEIAYNRKDDNTSGAILASLAVTGNTFNQILLLKQDLILPLYDIPFQSTINEYLDEKAVKELKKILLNYATILNDDGISFLLIGKGTPPLTFAHFDLTFRLNLAIVYKVCRFVPMGTGDGYCD